MKLCMPPPKSGRSTERPATAKTGWFVDGQLLARSWPNRTLPCINLDTLRAAWARSPASCSFNIEMICSSLNLLRFIRSSLCDVGLYQNLEEI
ncbi:MAG: hypothetical protein ACI9GK_001257 [Devosia sp.]|jgi:hypothetical protein